MSNSAGSPTPAGWYRDPSGIEQLRWWDGAGWTEHLAAIPEPSPVPSLPPVQAAPELPPVPSQPDAFAPIASQPAVSQPVIEPPVISPPSAAQAQAFIPGHDPSEQPYTPFNTSWNAEGRVGAYGQGAFGASDFARPGQWNTAGVWFLATSPLWSGVVAALAGYLVGTFAGVNFSSLNVTEPIYPVIVFTSIGISLILILLAASRDRSRLGRLGYSTTTAVWWVLLSVLVYLIIRTVRVRRESGRGLAPMIFYLATSVVIVVVGIGSAIAIPAFLATHGGISASTTRQLNATSLATGIQTGLDNDGGSFSVTCTPFAKPTIGSIDVTCIATDLTAKTTHNLVIEVDANPTGGAPNVKLLTVDPPITGTGG